MEIPFLIGVLLAQAQITAPPEEVRVEYVLVEVVARDKQERLVADLTVDDFVVTDGRKKVRVESFDTVDLRDAPVAGDDATSPVAPAAPPVRRSQVILALDFVFSGHGESLQSFRWLTDYLQGSERRAGLEYGAYSLEGGPITDEFDEDPSAVRAALEAYREEFEGRARDEVRDAPFAAREPADLSALEERFRDCHRNGGSSVQVWNCVILELTAYVQRENGRTVTILRELEELAGAFPDPDSLRTIVFVSPGFSLRPGTAAIQLADAYLPAVPPPTTSRPDRVRDPSIPDAALVAPRPGQVSFDAEFRRVLGVCADHRVKFYTVDLYTFGVAEARGVDASQRGQASGRVSQAYHTYGAELHQGLAELAGETGGAFRTGLKGLREFLEGSRFVYVLGYPRPPGKEGAFRRIKVKCLRKGVRLRHRTGYVL